MPKIKTHKGIAKRVKKTASGKLKSKKSFHGHKLTKKTGKKKRHLRQEKMLDKIYQKKYKKVLPYN